MLLFQISRTDDFDGWRKGARQALQAGLRPHEVMFALNGEGDDLFSAVGANSPGRSTKPAVLPSVPQAFLGLARQIVCHCDPERFALLYRLLFRLKSDKTLLQKHADPDVHRANSLAKEIRRDMHKMKAFVRFRKTQKNGTEHFVAWFEPSHNIVRLNAAFFVRRFATMKWSILTPRGCAHWDLEKISFSDSVPQSAAPSGDTLEDYWKSYYASIFNPARLKLDAMTSEMPKKYWKNLPEATLIPGLIANAHSRELSMRDAAPTKPSAKMMAHVADSREKPFPSRDEIGDLIGLRNALKGCRACPLWKPATQAVPGSGENHANIMFVGEQPGDMEDLSGKPFVGPAGQVLREVVEEIGQEIDAVYLTNAVKHFKFEPRGKKRLHKKPSNSEIEHCRWWLHREIELVQPKVVVALGASAALALTGQSYKISTARAAVYGLGNDTAMIITYHPSYLLRLGDEEIRQRARFELGDDIKQAFELIAKDPGAGMRYPVPISQLGD